jgi:hypothetical protein
VAVEKLGFPEKSQKSGDRKCLGDWEKSFIELPEAKQFLRNRSERVFQQPPLLSTIMPPAVGLTQSLSREDAVFCFSTKPEPIASLMQLK